MQASESHAWLRYPLLALAWLALWRLSALMQYAPHASLWFPPAGLTFAALLVIGWRAIPVLMICAVTVTFWVDRMYQSHASIHDLLLTGLVFGAVHCLSYGLGAGILRRIVRRRTMASLPAIITAFLVVVCLSSLCAALSGVQSLQVAGILDDQGATGLWLPWWIGDMAGTMVLAPLFLGLLSRGYPEITSWLGGLDFQGHAHPVGTYLSKLLLSVFLLSLVMLLAAHFKRQEIAFGVFFLIVPQMWIVYTESPFRSALSLAMFSTAMAIWMAALHLVEQALVYQFAICVIAASAYFGLAVPVLVASNKQLSEMAFNDSLTKVASKHHFFERSEHTLTDTRRYGLPASLILLDIDRFKDINDSFGHAVGDQALVRLAMTVKMQLRQSDVFGRFGGDEFMLLLPGTNLGHALSMAERLRRLLHDIAVPGTDRHLTASFGVVAIDPEETIMQAFKRADQLLLDAKRNGRNSIGSIEKTGS
ncbi:hypothetical protein LF63_0113555 [Oleiagrimonas soli]|uniref:diguanylate cyclase n=1 Tax=Oleiagrimonas soli TaxID=1543381 RepID=A0A099CTN4_9GAMM|nr:hypothetical protein LF63_0113555 [Oleiagrimonas soli]